MAILHQATLVPSKLELLERWLPGQPWIDGADVSSLEAVGAYRFDDPEGEVGMETHLVRTADQRLLQVPLTYRGSARPEAQASLVGTTEHSVLGRRWVYDACGDPVFVAALTRVIVQGGTQAELEVVTEDGLQTREAATRVSGSGTPGAELPVLGWMSVTSQGSQSVLSAEHLELTLLRTVDPSDEPATPIGAETLRGTWPGQSIPTLLAHAQIV